MESRRWGRVCRAGTKSIPSFTCVNAKRSAAEHVLSCTDVGSHFQMSPAVDNISLPVYLCFYYLLGLSVGRNSKFPSVVYWGLWDFIHQPHKALAKSKKYSPCSLCINRSRRYTWTLEWSQRVHMHYRGKRQLCTVQPWRKALKEWTLRLQSP